MSVPAEEPDFSGYVQVRWADLVAGLEEEGVEPNEARLLVSHVLLDHREGWERFIRDEQVDIVIWEEICERAGLPPRLSVPFPHGKGDTDPSDGPDLWLRRAAAERKRERRRMIRGLVIAGAIVVAWVAGWVWWATRPEPPPVREEANPLQVVWYSRGDLHLENVVVGLPGIETFVSQGPDVIARMNSGEVVRVSSDGAVEETDERPTTLDEVPIAPPFSGLGSYDVVLQTVPLEDGGWAYLIDSSRRTDSEEGVRQSESGRRALVVCPDVGLCSAPRTIERSEGLIRLR